VTFCRLGGAEEDERKLAPRGFCTRFVRLPPKLHF
jgi:hypothetical protein